MRSRKSEAIRDLKSRQVLFSCEGKAERVVIETLSEADALVVPNHNIVRDIDGRPCTLLRKAKDIQREFLGVDYPDGLLIGRIVEVNPGMLRWGCGENPGLKSSYAARPKYRLLL